MPETSINVGAASGSAEVFEVPAVLVEHKRGKRSALPRTLSVKIVRGGDGRARFVSLGENRRYSVRVLPEAVAEIARRIADAKEVAHVE